MFECARKCDLMLTCRRHHCCAKAKAFIEIMDTLNNNNALEVLPVLLTFMIGLSSYNFLLFLLRCSFL